MFTIYDLVLLSQKGRTDGRAGLLMHTNIHSK